MAVHGPHNKITDWYRKRKPEPLSSFADIDDPDAVLDAVALLPSEASENPDELLMRRAVWEELDEALDELPDEQRDVFVMHEIEGRSFKEIAEITGAPLNTLLSRKQSPSCSCANACKNYITILLINNKILINNKRRKENVVF